MTKRVLILYTGHSARNEAEIQTIVGVADDLTSHSRHNHDRHLVA